MIKEFDLEYNSQREGLIISEYGRNVQKLVDHAKTITNKEERQEFIEEVINLMNIMIPSNKSLVDNRQKMWNHIFKIANYDLDVDIPEGVTIHKSEGNLEAHDLKYPKSSYKYRHYGHYIQEMIKKARGMEDLDMKKGYSEVIASYMKLAYQTWNREHYVNDNVIVQDLEEISENELTFKDDYSIDNLISLKQLKQSTSRSKGGKKNNNNRKKKRRSN